ncbi:TIGR02594 family protein [uncultured Sphingomonas sp.]|uniref:TIGR02594 family protein n=1 Tax=uncultured Sphingomonas sp. TaxID=158754 RepID=UPI0025D809F5|nr:TIGR02594 family protein [uncultured Sphingomonas sp.]
MTTTEPAWLKAARAKLGTREAPGAANNPTIIGWGKRLGVKVLGIAYNADSVPWCGVFVAECLDRGGIDLAAEGMHRMRVAVRAKAWATWGANLAADRLAPGAILVFDREGGGHVGFYVGEDAKAYHVLGGNQGDAVSITRILKARCVARRWPRDVPVIGRPIAMREVAGMPLSRNEA